MTSVDEKLSNARAEHLAPGHSTAVPSRELVSHLRRYRVEPREEWMRRVIAARPFATAGEEETFPDATQADMGMPILKKSQHLIAALGPASTDTDMAQLRDALVQQVGRFRVRGVIVDVTALDVLDSFAFRTLRDLTQRLRLRGAETVIVGIQPEVAFAMIQLGITLESVTTALDLEGGISYLERKSRHDEISGK